MRRSNLRFHNITLPALLALLLLMFNVPANAHDAAEDLINIPAPTAEQVKLSHPTPATTAEIYLILSQMKGDCLEEVKVAATAALGETGNKYAIQPLTEALKDPSDHIQQAAARSLCKLCGAEQVELLVSMLKNDGLKPFNYGAVRALVNAGVPGQDALISIIKESDIPHCMTIIDLLSNLKDEPNAKEFFVRSQDILITAAKSQAIRPNSRVQLIAMLEQVGGSQVVDTLFQMLEAPEDLYGNIKTAAATAIVKINDPNGIKRLVYIAKKSELTQSRAAAVRALGSVKDKPAQDAVFSALKSTEPGVRISAAYALADIGDDHAIDALLKAVGDMDDKARGSAIAALGNIKETRAVEPLITILNATTPDPCIGTAVFALGKIGDARAVEALATVGSNHAMESRDFVCKALGEIKNPAAAKALIPYLDNTYPTELHQKPYDTVRNLIAMGPIAVESLLDALKSPNARIREGAAMVFQKTEDPRAVEPLISLLSDGDSYVRSAAATALGNQRDRKSIEQLVPLLKDANELVRACAAAALGQMGDSRGTDELIEFFEHYKPFGFSDLRLLSAVQAFGKLKEHRAENLLFDSFKTWDLEDTTELRNVTIEALISITGQDFGHDYFRWLSWAYAEGKWRPTVHQHPIENETHKD